MIRKSHIKELYKQFNIRVKFKNLNCGGCALIKKRSIWIDKKSFKETNDICRLHLIFHELCHILSADHGKFKNYYKFTGTKARLRDHHIVRKTGLRAERYCDRMAHKWIRSFYPNFPLDPGYLTKTSENWYKKEFLNRYFKK